MPCYWEASLPSWPLIGAPVVPFPRFIKVSILSWYPLFSVINLPLWQNCSCSFWGYTYFSFTTLSIRKSEILAQTPELLLYSPPNFSVICPLSSYCPQLCRGILSDKMGSALSQTSKAWYWLFNYETQLDFFGKNDFVKKLCFPQSISSVEWNRIQYLAALFLSCWYFDRIRSIKIELLVHNPLCLCVNYHSYLKFSHF